MQIKLVLGFFVASSSVLASVLPALGGLEKRSNDNCPDGSRRNPASAASQAGPLPYCANYVSTSVCRVTSVTTVTASHVVTKTVCKETDVTTTVQKTNTVTRPTVRVTTVVPVIVTKTTTSVTTTAAPPVVVTSTQLFKRNNQKPASTKCSCIVLITTSTVSSTTTKTVLATITITTTKSDFHTKSTTTTTTLSPTVTTTVPTTSTTTTTTTTTTAIASTSTTILAIPTGCGGDLTASPVNLSSNTISHPESTYTSIYTGRGLPMPNVLACCIACYSNPNCITFNFGNFDPLFGNSFEQSYCQVLVTLEVSPPLCAVKQRGNMVIYRNPAIFGAGPADFFYAGAGPCSEGIDISTIG